MRFAWLVPFVLVTSFVEAEPMVGSGSQGSAVGLQGWEVDLSWTGFFPPNTTLNQGSDICIVSQNICGDLSGLGINFTGGPHVFAWRVGIVCAHGCNLTGTAMFRENSAGLQEGPFTWNFTFRDPVYGVVVGNGVGLVQN